MDKMRFFIITGLSLVLVACGGKKEELVAPVRVKTEVVGEATDINTKTYVGIVEEREATAVSFTGMGVVKRVLVSEGQVVGRGQLIAEMDDTQARHQLSAAKAAMEQAQDALERYKMLYDNGSLPEVRWVEIQSQEVQAKSKYEATKKSLADCLLTAPVSGIIGKKMVGVGETALPSQAVVTILDISSVKVKVSIPEAEISGITASTPSTISVEAVEATVGGGRIEKGVQADALTHTYDIRINVENRDRVLMPGMVASVSLTPTLSSRDEGSDYFVPVTAVQKRADGNLFVWTIDKDNTARRKTVSIGHTMGNRIIVSSGIAIGERIVTEGYQKLSEGRKVVF